MQLEPLPGKQGSVKICLLSLVGVPSSVLLLVDAESSLTFAFAINFTTDTRETNENTNMIGVPNSFLVQVQC